jgi:hypothetical protein
MAKKGFIYIMSNEAMPGLLKIGYSIRIPTERLDELFTTGVPDPFQLLYYCLVDNVQQVEIRIHQRLSRYRHRDNREFFRLAFADALFMISNLCSPEHVWQEEATLSEQIKSSNDCKRSSLIKDVTSFLRHEEIVTKTQLGRKFQQLTPKERMEIIQYLISNHKIQEHIDRTAGRPGCWYEWIE